MTGSGKKSGHKGVSFNKSSGKWMAYISRDGKHTHLGTFADVEDAIAARKQAEKDNPPTRQPYDAETQAWIEAAETKEERKKRLQRAKYLRHGDKYRERQRADYAADPEKFSERAEVQRELHHDKIAADKKAWEKKFKEEHPEKWRAQRHAIYERRKDKVAEYGRKWRENNPQRKAANAAFMREYRKEHRDEINRKQREVYAANPEPARARGAEWRAENPEKYKAQIERQAERYRNDPDYRDYKLQKCKESYERRFPAIQEYEKMRRRRDQEKLSAYQKKWRTENAADLAVKKVEWERQDKLKNPGKYKAKYSAYRAMKIQRSVAWANLDAIAFVYDNCPEGCEVDHIIPLQGENISGLHVAENLQWLTILENRMKGNTWDGDD